MNKTTFKLINKEDNQNEKYKKNYIQIVNLIKDSINAKDN